jgi:hypothetical protein
LIDAGRRPTLRQGAGCPRSNAGRSTRWTSARRPAIAVSSGWNPATEKITDRAPAVSWVVELHNFLHLITKDGGFPLADGQVARVRTFASSIRHKEVVATVEENAASLTGFHVVK